MIPRVLLFTLLLVPPLALQAQREVDPGQRIEAALQQAAAAGLPVAALHDKISEGRAKGVAPERIAAAVERRLNGLTQARAAMREAGQLNTADLVLGADALDAGVSAGVLGVLAAAAPRSQRAVAIAALVQLTALGHLPEHALERVIEALRRGPDALAQLPAQAASSARRGPAGGDALRLREGAGGVGRGPPPTVPAPGVGRSGGRQNPKRPPGTS